MFLKDFLHRVVKSCDCVVKNELSSSNPFNLDKFNPFPNKPLYLRVCKKRLENSVGKVEIAHKKQFLVFSQCFFLFFFFNTSAIFITLKLPSANSFSLEGSMIFTWERIKTLYLSFNGSTFYETIQCFNPFPHNDAF